MKPPALKPGNQIGVMAPASYVESGDIEKAKTLMEKRGYNVFIHPQTYERHNQSAGTHLQKSLALQGLWQRDDIDAIWAAGGGNRCLHILDIINFETMKKKPKIFIGFSDVTALLNSIYAHTGINSFHGPVFKDLHKHKQMSHLLSLLSGEVVEYPANTLTILKEGSAEGHLIGGNLSIFQYLPLTLPGSFWEGSLLFLEDCNEELSKIDRMLLHLKRSGVLKQIGGLILGQFTNMTENGRPFGFTLEDIILEHTEDLNIPIVMNAPFGHGEKLYTFPIGIRAALKTNPPQLTLLESATT